MNPWTAFFVPALLMGLFGSVHCMTMCGGIAGAVTPAGPGSSWLLRLSGQVGRLLSYGTWGALAATFGGALGHIVPLDVVRLVVRILAFFMLVGVGLHLTGISSIIRVVERVGGPLNRAVGPFARRLFPVKSLADALLVGLVWGLLPCGLLYGAVVLAMGAPSAPLGAATVVAFGVGTLPALLASTLFAGFLKRPMGTAWPRRAAGALVLVFGLVHGSLALDGARALANGTSADCHPRSTHAPNASQDAPTQASREP
jgi:sulfite exporter TauE/SafE